MRPCSRPQTAAAISAAGVFRTDDAGQTWQPTNRGLKSPNEIPDPEAEVGYCVHRIAMHPSRPGVLFMQKHWDVMAATTPENLGTRSAAICRPISDSRSMFMRTNWETIYLVPIKSDSQHFPPDLLRLSWHCYGGSDLTDWMPLGYEDYRAIPMDQLKSVIH
jgi:hypothetical protein